jgi:tripartite-type tricarboxylate transporter receptor subunit TctC
MSSVVSINRRLALFAAFAAIARPIRAQPAWPSRPVTLVLGFPPGGPNDLVARVLTQHLGDLLKQPFIVENRPGANGNIATALVAHAQPDGYTFLYNSSSLALSPALYRKLPVDPLHDLMPVSGTATLPLVCVVASSFPATNYREWVAQIRAHPGQFNYGSPGIGNLAHVAAAMVLKAEGLDAVHTPYKGSSEALQGLIGGSTQFQFDAVNSPLAFIRSGKLKPLFVTSAERSPALPDVPTLRESGATSIEAGAWQGVMAPLRTPPAIVQEMADAIGSVMVRPDVKTILAGQGAYAMALPPQRYGAFIADQADRFRRVVDDLNLKLD